MSFLKYHKSDVDNYGTRDCEIYCLSKTRHNPLGIHKKSQCCQLTDTARDINNSEEDKKKEEKARKEQSESGLSRWDMMKRRFSMDSIQQRMLSQYILYSV